MKNRLITASLGGRQVTFTIAAPETLSEMIELYGELVVFDLAFSKYKEKAMISAREQLQTRTPIDVQKRMNKWHPNKRLSRLDVDDALEDL